MAKDHPLIGTIDGENALSSSISLKLAARAMCFASVAALCLPQSATSQIKDDTLDSLSDALAIPVTVDNFVRAATEAEFEKYLSLAGGLNQFFHFFEPTPIDNQPTIRMNRDTLYSAAVVDISEGATLTLPDVGDRYMTTMIVNQDHYTEEVLSGGGTFTLDMDTFGTPYVIVFMRILVNASDPEDVAAVNDIQRAFTIDAGAANAFVPSNYDQDSLRDMISTILLLGPFTPDSTRMFGPRDEVDGVRHFIGTAAGWAGLPEKEAFYLSIDPGLPVAEYRIDVPADVPVDAFWSLSLYNANGFFEKNPLGAYNVNSVNGERNEDGGMTIHLGGCDDGRINCLPVMEGWNYTIRLYQPSSEVIDGTWTFPEAQLLE